MVGKWKNEAEMKFTMKNDEIIGDHDPKWTKKTSLQKLTFDALTRYPNTIGQIDANTGEKLTFAEMKDCSIRCALWLQKQNLGKNDIVSITCYTQMNDYVPILGCVFTGIIGCPWSNELTAAEARYYFDVVDPKIMFACEETIEMLSEVATEMRVDCKFVVIGNHPKFPSLMDLLAEQSQEEVDNFSIFEPKNPTKELGMIFFSSGTTGNPKGTMLTFESFVNPRLNFTYSRNFSNNLWYANICWTVGVSGILSGIKDVSTRIVHRFFDPYETSRIIEKYKVNHVFVSPTKMTSMCVANVFDHYTFPSLETFYFGGSKCNKIDVKRFRQALPHVLILNGYGMTELGGLACVQRVNCKGLDSIGFVVENVTLKIVDTETGQKVGPNKEGEICIQVYNKMLGYFKNPKATEEMIDEEDWVHTGDLGYFDEDGEVYITNRIKEVIITKNRKISPSRIMEILTNHPGVSDASVLAVPHELDGERPLAFVIKNPDYNVTAEELKILPKSYNPFYELTGGVVFLSDFPVTASGKKNFKKLKAMANDYRYE